MELQGRDCKCLVVQRLGRGAKSVGDIFQSYYFVQPFPLSPSTMFPHSPLSSLPSMTMSYCFCLFAPDSAVYCSKTTSHHLHPRNPPTSHSSHLPQTLVSLSSITWHCRSAQVEAGVVLSLSGFTHSRYYHQAPVSFTDKHLGKAASHLADNDGCAFRVRPDAHRWRTCTRRGLVMLDSHAVIFSDNFALPSDFIFSLACRLSTEVPLKSF